MLRPLGEWDDVMMLWDPKTWGTSKTFTHFECRRWQQNKKIYDEKFVNFMTGTKNNGHSVIFSRLGGLSRDMCCVFFHLCSKVANDITAKWVNHHWSAHPFKCHLLTTEKSLIVIVWAQCALQYCVCAVCPLVPLYHIISWNCSLNPQGLL
jgi:hypothetical protein